MFCPPFPELQYAWGAFAPRRRVLAVPPPDRLKAQTRCTHGRRRCRECGKGYCPCGVRRDDCRQCGVRFCPCGRRKDCCAKCGGSQVGFFVGFFMSLFRY